MALQEYLGAIVLEVDGREIDIVSLDTNESTGRTLVKTMNREGRAKGFVKGIATYELTVTAVIPATGDIDWAAIQGAKITVYPVASEDKRVSYLDCFTISVGNRYDVENEARRDVQMAALRRVEE